MTFACLSTANVHYGSFDGLQKRPLLAFQITTGSVIAIYYGKYGKLHEGLEDQLILDNDEIAGDVKDAEKAEGAGDIGKVEDRGDGEDTRMWGRQETQETQET